MLYGVPGGCFFPVSLPQRFFSQWLEEVVAVLEEGESSCRFEAIGLELLEDDSAYDLILVGKDGSSVDIGGKVVGDAVENANDVVDPECVGATASKLYEGGVLSHIGGD